MSTLDLARMHVATGIGEKVSFMGMDLFWTVTPEMSGDTFAQFMHISPPGTGVPMHIHHNEQESLCVLEGELVARLEGDSVTCRPGDTLMMPKGIAHGWRVTGVAPARILFTFEVSPGSDWKSMFAGLVGLAPTDFEQIKAVCAPNHIEFIEPPDMP